MRTFIKQILREHTDPMKGKEKNIAAVKAYFQKHFVDQGIVTDYFMYHLPSQPEIEIRFIISNDVQEDHLIVAAEISHKINDMSKYFGLNLNGFGYSDTKRAMNGSQMYSRFKNNLLNGRLKHIML